MAVLAAGVHKHEDLSANGVHRAVRFSTACHVRRSTGGAQET